MIERSLSRSPSRIQGGKPSKRHNYFLPSPLSNSYDSEAERMIKQQRLSKREQYKNILQYQIKEKEKEKQLQRETLHEYLLFDDNDGKTEKFKKQKEFRKALQEQIEAKERYKAQQKIKQDEYERKLEAAIKNMNRRVWDESKTESQREREKDQLKRDLQSQINERKMKDNMSFKQK